MAGNPKARPNSISIKGRLWTLLKPRWAEFETRRKAIAEELGVRPIDAEPTWQALKEFFPDGVPGFEDGRPNRQEIVKAHKEAVEARPKHRGLPLTPRDSFGEPSKVSLGAAVDWVFENLCIEDLLPEDAPSPGAWGLLQWARLNPVNTSAYYATMASKRMPSRIQEDKGERFGDDGGEPTETIDRLLAIEASLPPPRPEGESPQPPVPQGTDSARQ